MRNYLATLALLFAFSATLFAQNESSATLWEPLDAAQLRAQEMRFVPKAFQSYRLDIAGMADELKKAPQKAPAGRQTAFLSIDLPTADGAFESFEIYEASVMEAPLQAKYPNIRTYTGRGKDDRRKLIKLDVGGHGFHAMIWGMEATTVIEPVYAGNRQDYMVFHKHKLAAPDIAFSCGVDPGLNKPDAGLLRAMPMNPTGPTLRTYRAAISATGEYTQYHGGTVPLAMAAIVTSMNRINGVYEREVTITMILVANNDTLVFTNPNTDPFTNSSTFTMLGENVAVCDARIGQANYDIGHVFGTGGGGVAGLGVVCASGKARGVTTLTPPVGDVFDIDYVSHEMGHQFASNHTFNDCGGQGPQPYEPGSAVTIMGYAGLCGGNNIANNSIDQFHVASYDEIIQFSQSGGGNSCPVMTNTGNDAPIVTVPSGGWYIPYQTPFELTGSASDPNGDSLTYCWEQYDLGPSTPPQTASGTAPLFRTWKPVPTPTRVFPREIDLVNNTSTIGELLPQFGRVMNFRMTVRDNNPGAGGVDYGQLAFDVANNSGPFLVMAPNGGETWNGGGVSQVTWDVANTDLAPVSCSSVDIYLSEDGGYTWPHVVATGVPNTGSAFVTVPNIAGTTMRMKVKGANNIFFDISNANFEIVPTTQPDFTVFVPTPLQTICVDDTVTYTIQLDSLLGYSDSVTLSLTGNPTGTQYLLNPTTSAVPGTVLLTVWDPTGNVAPGSYPMTLTAVGTSGTKTMPLTLEIQPGAPGATALAAPVNGATGILGAAPLTWNAVQFATTYEIEISESPAFTTIAQSAGSLPGTSYTPSPALNANTVYYWRVRVDQSNCGAAPWSPTWSFQTEVSSCATFVSTDVPKVISAQGTPTVQSVINVTQSFNVTDVNIVDLQGTHTWVSDLNFRLISPGNTNLSVWGNICGNDDDFNLEFDDASPAVNIPCPPTNGLIYKPIDAFAAYNGQGAQGNWTLEIFDDTNQDGGELQSWALEICGPPVNTNPPTVVQNQLEVPQGDVGTITDSLLSGTCPGAGSQLIYTLTSLPANGDLYLNGTLLGLGDQFTQTDIDNGLLTYDHDSTNTTTDSFTYDAVCTNGGYLGNQTFPISITPNVGILEAFISSFSVFPNPSEGDFFVKVEGRLTRNAELRLVDLSGRVVQAVPAVRGTNPIEVDGLPGGVYLLSLRDRDRVLAWEKLVLIGQ